MNESSRTGLEAGAPSAMTPGNLTLALAAALEREGVSYVYLRNYERLPEDVGNDVDLLVAAGNKRKAAAVLRREAVRFGWLYLGETEFSSLAVYFADAATGETLHLDLFDKLCWHFLEYADAEGFLERRVWNGRVFIPDPRDELYLNLSSRLIYHGNIREKHRKLAADRLAEHGGTWVGETFERHLGTGGAAFARTLQAADWKGNAALRNELRKRALGNLGTRRWGSLLASCLGYGGRIIGKLRVPPGKFLVFEGADGVGKSTILEAVIPWLRGWCAGRDPYDFHWKPLTLHTGERQASPSVDPRGKGLRGPVASLAYLAYHLAGFWWGWCTRIYPRLIRSHAIVGDRYSYDLFLDPHRFRLDLPDWVCRWAAKSAPRPDLAVGLHAPPETVHARKPELSPEEIARYQARWRSLSAGRPWMISVAAEGPREEVIARVKRAILVAMAERVDDR